MCNILHFCGVKNGLVAKLVVMNYAAGGCIFFVFQQQSRLFVIVPLC